MKVIWYTQNRKSQVSPEPVITNCWYTDEDQPRAAPDIKEPPHTMENISKRLQFLQRELTQKCGEILTTPLLRVGIEMDRFCHD